MHVSGTPKLTASPNLSLPSLEKGDGGMDVDVEKRAYSRGSSSDGGDAKTAASPTKSDGEKFDDSAVTTPTICSRAASKEGLASRAVNRRSGRPDVYKILEEEVTTAQGAVAVDGTYPSLHSCPCICESARAVALFTSLPSSGSEKSIWLGRSACAAHVVNVAVMLTASFLNRLQCLGPTAWSTPSALLSRHRSRGPSPRSRAPQR